jgi:hypothetical protein
MPFVPLPGTSPVPGTRDEISKNPSTSCREFKFKVFDFLEDPKRGAEGIAKVPMICIQSHGWILPGLKWLLFPIFIFRKASVIKHQTREERRGVTAGGGR